jgi:hypothetical protein
MRKWCAALVFGPALVTWAGVAAPRVAAQTMPAPSTQAPTPAPTTSVQTAPAAQSDASDQTQAVLAAVKAALGGDAKIAALKSLSAEGSERRVMGENERTFDIQLAVVFPNHIQRIEQFELPTGMPGPRLAQTVNGDEFWFASLDPMPAGMNFIMNGQGARGDAPGGGRGAGGPGGPGGNGGGPGSGGARAGGPGGRQGQQIKAELVRTLAGILPVPSVLPADVTFKYAGDAKSGDGGAADVLDVKSADFQARLFIDKQTHLPLMMTYQGPDPAAMAQRMRNFQRREGETPEAARARVDEERKKREAAGPPPPPPQVEYQMYFADHKKVDGVMLPTRVTRAVNGNTVQELKIDKYKLNAKIDLAQFQKKGS